MKKYLFLIVVLLYSQAWGIKLGADISDISLSPVTQVLEDPSGKLTINDVIAPQMAALFKTYPLPANGDFNFGFTGSAYWFRIPLQRKDDSPSDWLLRVSYTSIQFLDFHAPDKPVVRTGSLRQFSSRPYFDRHFVFPVTLKTEPQYFYVRATSRHALTVPLYATEHKAFIKSQTQYLALQFLYYGGLLSLLFYNLFIGFALKDGRFLLYSVYVLLFGLGIFSGNGYGRLLLWPDSPGFDEISQSCLLSASACLAVIFSRVFLQTRKLYPFLDRLLKVSLGMFFLCCVLFIGSIWMAIPLKSINQLLMMNSLLTGVLIFIAAVKAICHRDLSARFFLLAWTVLWLGVCAAVLRAFDVLPTNSLTSYALQIASAAEMLLLSLALADIIHTERKHREQFQAQALDAHQKMLSVLKNSEAQLEQAVYERTQELKQALKSQKDILAQYVRFGALISHEFRNPLAVIKGQLTVLNRENQLGMLQLERRTSIMGAAVRRLQLLFDKWVQSDWLKGDSEQIHPVRIVLHGWLQRQIDANAYRIDKDRAECSFSAGNHEIIADQALMEMAIGNLLENACKYSPPDSRIFIQTRAKPGYTGISIRDQGDGIPAEHQERVFDAFFRVAPQGSVLGAGLGLFIVRQIVRAHGGHLELVSAPGKGSDFCIWLQDGQPTHSHVHLAP